MAIEISSILPEFTDEQLNVLQGPMPFKTIIESMVEQFNEFQRTDRITGDPVNYIDTFNDAVKITEQIHQSAFEEFELAEGILRQMKEAVQDVLLYCMTEIGCDTYQLNDPFETSYQLYNNFMLTDQRQIFFEYTIDRILDRIDPLSDFFKASRAMKDGNPKPMYDLISDLDLKQDDSIPAFLEASGNEYIGELVNEGFIPENIMLDLFLKPISLSMAYSTYYMHKMT